MFELHHRAFEKQASLLIKPSAAAISEDLMMMRDGDAWTKNVARCGNFFRTRDHCQLDVMLTRLYPIFCGSEVPFETQQSLEPRRGRAFLSHILEDGI